MIDSVWQWLNQTTASCLAIHKKNAGFFLSNKNTEKPQIYFCKRISCHLPRQLKVGLLNIRFLTGYAVRRDLTYFTSQKFGLRFEFIWSYAVYMILCRMWWTLLAKMTTHEALTDTRYTISDHYYVFFFNIKLWEPCKLYYLKKFAWNTMKGNGWLLFKMFKWISPWKLMSGPTDNHKCNQQLLFPVFIDLSRPHTF